MSHITRRSRCALNVDAIEKPRRALNGKVIEKPIPLAGVLPTSTETPQDGGYVLHGKEAEEEIIKALRSTSQMRPRVDFTKSNIERAAFGVGGVLDIRVREADILGITNVFVRPADRCESVREALEKIRPANATILVRPWHS